MTCDLLARRGCAAGAALAGMLLLGAAAAHATDRVHRVFDQRRGLPTDHVTSVAQDAAGFLWIGTPGGLVRFDGDEMRLWDGTSRGIRFVRTAATGAIVAVDDRTALLRVDPSVGIDEFPGPDGAALRAVEDVLFDASGALWILRRDEVLRHGTDGAWLRLPRYWFDGQLLRGVRVDGDASVFVLTDRGIWCVSAAGEIRQELAIAWPVDVVRQHDRTLVVLGAALFVQQRTGELKPVLRLSARPIDLVSREGAVWASYDRYVARVSPNEAPIVIGPDDGLPGGGQLLVDREGSLWVGSFRGLIQFPEPDAVAWTERDGLPSTHARFLGRTPQAVWISTWAGLARIPTGADPLRVEAPGAPHQGDICVDGSGGLWYSEPPHLYELRNGRTTTHRVADPRLRFCTLSRDGTVWLGVGRELVRAGPGRFERFTGPPVPAPRGGLASPLVEDARGRLWVGADGSVCSADPSKMPAAEAWTCEPLPDGAQPLAMIESNGVLWVGTETDGVFRRRPGWEQIPGSRALGGGRVFKLRHGRDGTIWVLGLGRPTRVVDRPESPDGWEIVEVLSDWHGHPSGGASDLIEETNGTIWTASAAGVTRVPGRARRAPVLAPAVALAGVIVDGRQVPVDRLPPLGHRANLVELRFAALTYRDRSRIRYNVRLGSAQEWTTLTGGEPVFRFAELPAGSYVAEVRASLDGQNWSPAARRLQFQVSSPWYRRSWFLALAACVLAALLTAAHRARLSLALRLERQRMQIAMDLHDEIGSGLGSIGILAGVAGGTANPEHHPVVHEIGRTAGELSTALGDIVWSLRSRTRTLQELAERLAERGHRLFPDEAPEFVCRLPDTIPSVVVSLAVQRNVLRIAAEALHNAARHARARRVELELASDGARWRLRISDDGAGFDLAAAARAGGLGLSSLQRRASHIGAALDIVSTPGRGTTVSLVFDARAEPRSTASRMSMRGTRASGVRTE